MQAISRHRCSSYWSGTGAFSAVAAYINMNFDGLKDNIIEMLAGGRCKVDPTSFQNDISEIHSRDEVLTVLIHLGYVGYDWRSDECYIPNREVGGEMVNAVAQYTGELLLVGISYDKKKKQHDCRIERTRK